MSNRNKARGNEAEKIMGIDPSIGKGLGCAILDFEDDTVELFTIRVPAGGPDAEKILELSRRCVHIARDRSVALVAVEHQFAPLGAGQGQAGKARSALRLAGLVGGLQVAFGEAGIEVVQYAPTVGKFALCEAGFAIPATVKAAVREIYGVKIVTDDQAHAVGLAMAAQLQRLQERERER